jgi:hypothetical protein
MRGLVSYGRVLKEDKHENERSQSIPLELPHEIECSKPPCDLEQSGTLPSGVQKMRLAGRALLLTIGLALAVREGGNPNADTIALELRTEVVMTAEGLVILPVFVPATAKIARRCSLPTISRPGATESEMIAAKLNRAAECALLDGAAKP